MGKYKHNKIVQLQ